MLLQGKRSAYLRSVGLVILLALILSIFFTTYINGQLNASVSVNMVELANVTSLALSNGLEIYEGRLSSFASRHRQMPETIPDMLTGLQDDSLVLDIGIIQDQPLSLKNPDLVYPPAKTSMFKKAVITPGVIQDPFYCDSFDRLVFLIISPDNSRVGKAGQSYYLLLDLEWLSLQTDQIKLAGKGNTFVVDSANYTIAHDNRQLVKGRDNDFENVKQDSRLKPLLELEKRMISGETGSGKYFYNGIHKFLGFTPIKGTTWSVAVAAPEGVVFGYVRTAMFYLMLCFLLFVGLIVYFSLTMNKIIYQTVLERTSELNEANESLQQLNAELEETVATLSVTQAQLIESEKLAALGSLVAGVAHELSTPVGNALTVTTSCMDRHQEFLAIPPNELTKNKLNKYLSSVQEAGDILLRNLERAINLIRSFKQVAVDQSSYQRRLFRLAELIQEVLLTISPTIRKAKVQVTVEVPEGLQLDSYPGPLGQVLINLINNAIVHGFEGREAGEIRLTAKELADRRVAIAVSDNGRGIESKDVPHIFEPFYTTKLGHGSSGLGLHIVYNLITGLLGGTIQASSQPGVGTEFLLQLPLSAPRETEKVPEEAQEN